MASNEFQIHVWDLTKVLESSKNDLSKISNETKQENDYSVDAEPKVDDITNMPTNISDVTSSESVKTLTPVHSQPTVVLSGHIQRVIFLAWSPHEDGKLLSVSYDNTAQVCSTAFVPNPNLFGARRKPNFFVFNY